MASGIIVQKFGGTSLHSPEVRARARHHILRAVAGGHRVVVVVSAMGRMGQPYATDTLYQMVGGEGSRLPQREVDLLLSCGEMISATVLAHELAKEGHRVRVLTGGQAGIITDDRFGDAQIQTVYPERIIQELDQGRMVIVCGFQGITLNGEVTTLGRGGSDTTAVALGVALQADYVDIFTDVQGVMTADPKLVKEAVMLPSLTYSELANLAHQGAKVMHPRSVALAMQGNLTVRIRSIHAEDVGTVISHALDRGQKLQERPITGITYMSHLTQVKVRAESGQYDLQLRVFKCMAENGISVDFINASPAGVAFTIPDAKAELAKQLIQQLGYQPEMKPSCAKVSAVGAGMAGLPGVMAAIVEALTEENIPILQTADSHATIWVLVHQEDLALAVRSLHRKFGLHLPQRDDLEPKEE